MGFYLIGRGRSAGEMRLISDVLYDDRQAALDELSRLSAAADFAHRDAEVFVVDLATGVPVLLVPSSVEVPAEPVTVDVEPTPVEETVVEADASNESDDTAGVWEAPAVESVEEPIAQAVTDQLAEEPVTEEPITEVVTDQIPEPPIAEPVIEQIAEEPMPLADALKRAAGAMESEGIIAPESVGPATAAAWPWEAGEQANPGADEVESGAEPVDGAVESVSEDEYVPSALEEPAIDGDGGLLKTASPEEETPMPRPVIMGDYAEDEASESDSDTEMDGILADLETIEEPSDTDVPAGPQPDQPPTAPQDTPTGDLTCDDCVYVTTCPHKDDLEPSSCGNFQWKSV